MKQTKPKKKLKAAHPDLALASMLSGASTSADIADELGVSIKYASAILSDLLREGSIRWRGRYTPREPGKRGPGARVYEVDRE